VGSIIDINTFFGLSRERPTDWSLDTLLRLLDRAGVARALTLSLRGVYYDFVAGNEETLRACAAHPQLVPVATVDPRRYVGCREEIRRCLDRGVRLFRFFPDLQGWALDGLDFLRLVEALAGQGVLMVPANRPGWPSLAARYLAPLGVPVVLLGVGYSVFGELLAALAAHPNLYCDGMLFDSPGAYELVCAEVGAGRVMFGSGLPERYFASARLMVEHADLTPQQRAAIFYRNAARVLLAEEA
jgi:predicted TIM-barrel fold metal-dependent hydrolase